MTNFTPHDDSKQPDKLPYFEDIKSGAGWTGHTTGIDLEELRHQLSVELSRLGANITTFQSGRFFVNNQEREGYRIEFTSTRGDGVVVSGRLDLAGLPMRKHNPNKEEKVRKMILYMSRDIIRGQFQMTNLNPGHAPLIPWMLEEGGEYTFSQLWTQNFDLALPPGPDPDDVVEGDFKDVED